MSRIRPLALLILSGLLAQPLAAQQFEAERVVPLDGAFLDWFGISVAVSGDLMVVGSPWNDDAGEKSGSAYVFRRDPLTRRWVQEQKLRPSDPAAADEFGRVVAIHGDVIAVGSPMNDDMGDASGSVYLYRFHRPVFAWLQEQKLNPPDGATGCHYGSALSLSGDLLVVGAPNSVQYGTDTGSAYVYRYEWGDSRWHEEAQFEPAGLAAGDRFGAAVAVNGDAVAVGSPGDDDHGTDSGSVAVFRYKPWSASWLQESRLDPADPLAGKTFGAAVALSGGLLAVGAPGDQDFFLSSGAAYVFRYAGGNAWTEEAKLRAPDAAGYDYFGTALAAAGDRVLVGVPRDDDNGSSSGSAYLFRRYAGDGAWVLDRKLLASDGKAADEFGIHVALAAGQPVVGARMNTSIGTGAGEVYVYRLMNLAPATLKPLAGSQLEVPIDGAKPGARTYLAFTQSGPGSTRVGALDLYLDLTQPLPAGPLRIAASDGSAGWVLRIPASLAGQTVWLQAAQRNRKSNPIRLDVQ